MSNYEECRINGALWRRDKNGDWQPVEEPNEVAPGVDPKWYAWLEAVKKRYGVGLADQKLADEKEFMQQKVYGKSLVEQAEPQCNCNILNPCQDCLARWKEEKNCE